MSLKRMTVFLLLFGFLTACGYNTAPEVAEDNLATLANGTVTFKVVVPSYMTSVGLTVRGNGVNLTSVARGSQFPLTLPAGTYTLGGTGYLTGSGPYTVNTRTFKVTDNRNITVSVYMTRDGERKW